MLAASLWADFMAKVSESLALLPSPWTGGESGVIQRIADHGPFTVSYWVNSWVVFILYNDYALFCAINWNVALIS